MASPVPMPRSLQRDPANPSLPSPALPDALLSPVQFSKEKYILDSSPEKLHKELEEELKLSSTDLRSHAWYHGRIPREVSRGRWVAPGILCLGCSWRAPPGHTEPACPDGKPLSSLVFQGQGEQANAPSNTLMEHPPVWLCLRSCPVPFQVSESLVQRNGDFLIRDSLTSLGDYVLTCRWRNEPLHFKINKATAKPGEGHARVQYLFEQESFDNVPALVRFYVGNRKAISEQSGAIIYCPINRTFPLRYLEASYGLGNGKHGGAHSPATQKGGHIKRRSITMTDGLTADKITRAEGCPSR